MMLKYIFLLQNTHKNKNEILAVTNQLCPENFVY